MHFYCSHDLCHTAHHDKFLHPSKNGGFQNDLLEKNRFFWGAPQKKTLPKQRLHVWCSRDKLNSLKQKFWVPSYWSCI